MKKPNNYWTYGRCKEESLRYDNRKDLMLNNCSVYAKIKKNKWYELFSHMKLGKMPKNYWTKDKCKEEALKYETKADFQYNSSTSYSVSLKNGWISDICIHMKNKLKPNGYWINFERCKEEASKYKNRSTFKKESPSAWDSARNNNWLDDICSHMTYLGDKIHRCVYVCEFSDKSAYIGLTFNFEKRKQQHLNSKRSSVYKYIIEKNIIPNFVKLTDYIEVDKAVIMEENFVLKYRNEKWKILNKVKTGGLGYIYEKWNRKK